MSGIRTITQRTRTSRARFSETPAISLKSCLPPLLHAKLHQRTSAQEECHSVVYPGERQVLDTVKSREGEASSPKLHCRFNQYD